MDRQVLIYLQLQNPVKHQIQDRLGIVHIKGRLKVDTLWIIRGLGDRESSGGRPVLDGDPRLIQRASHPRRVSTYRFSTHDDIPPPS